MPEIHYRELERHLGRPETEWQVPAYLIYGEEMLCKNARDQLLNALMPDAHKRNLHYEAVAEGVENIYAVIEKVKTYSLLSGPKIIAIHDARLFYARRDKGLLLSKSKEAHYKDDMRRAARYFMTFLGLTGIALKECLATDWKKLFKEEVESVQSADWLKEVIDYCVEKDQKVPEREGPLKALENAVDKGFPKGNTLMVTTDGIDKRRGLYKAFIRRGLVINCAIPLGERKADRAVQEEALKDQARQILSKTDKTMDRAAYHALVEKTGFDLFTFKNNLEKLSHYIGERKSITVDDIETTLTRSKLDPIYALTNAVAERKLETALKLLKSLFGSGVHPLQALAAIVNQTRKLLRIKGLTEHLDKHIWHAGTTFNQFKAKVVPFIQKDDSELKKSLADWQDSANGGSKGGDMKKSGRRKGRTGSGKSVAKKTDLQILKNPGNAYPVYRLFLQAENFSKEDLVRGMERLTEADLLLKSSGQNPKLILERVVFEICGA